MSFIMLGYRNISVHRQSTVNNERKLSSERISTVFHHVQWRRGFYKQEFRDYFVTKSRKFYQVAKLPYTSWPASLGALSRKDHDWDDSFDHSSCIFLPKENSVANQKSQKKDINPNKKSLFS